MPTIRSIKSRIVTLNAHQEIIEEYLHREQSFNENGHLTTDIIYDEKGDIESKSIFELDEAGDILVQMNYERLNNLVERTEFFESADLIQNKSEITTQDGRKTIHEYLYNQLGNTDRIIIKNEEGEVEAYEIFQFNEQNQVIKEVRQDASFQTQFLKKYWYRKDGLLEKEEFYESGVTPYRKIEYQYNDQSFIIQKDDINMETGTEMISRYSYDMAGNQILDETSQNGKLLFKNFCMYNSNNSLIEERVMNLGTENYVQTIYHEIVYGDQS